MGTYTAGGHWREGNDNGGCVLFIFCFFLPLFMQSLPFSCYTWTIWHIHSSSWFDWSSLEHSQYLQVWLKGTLTVIAEGKQLCSSTFTTSTKVDKKLKQWWLHLILGQSVKNGIKWDKIWRAPQHTLHFLLLHIWGHLFLIFGSSSSSSSGENIIDLLDSVPGAGPKLITF